MDPELIGHILDAMMGGGGVVGSIIAWRTFRKRKDGEVPADEGEARRTADWVALNSYFQQELRTLRNERTRAENGLKQEIAKLRSDQENLRAHFQAQAEADAEFIDALEQHIWLRLPPPPPVRRRPGAPPAIPGT